jgi:hypothetical protein
MLRKMMGERPIRKELIDSVRREAGKRGSSACVRVSSAREGRTIEMSKYLALTPAGRSV